MKIIIKLQNDIVVLDCSNTTIEEIINLQQKYGFSELEYKH